MTSEVERLLTEILDKLTSIETLLEEQNTAMTEPDDAEDEDWRRE